MSRTVQARLDPRAEQDLALLRDEGHNDSDAIRGTARTRGDGRAGRILARGLSIVRGEGFRSARAANRPRPGTRLAVVVQADELMALSTVLVCPTSRSAQARSFRPTIDVRGTATRVLVEQATAIDPRRLGDSVGRLDAAELRRVDEALALVLGL